MPVVVGCSDDVSCESRSRDPQALSSAHTTPGIRAVAGSSAAVKSIDGSARRLGR